MNSLAMVQPDAAFAYEAVRELARQWNAKHVNRSGMHATFRRWRPDRPLAEENAMMMYVVGAVGLPPARARSGAAPADAADFLGRIPDWQIEHVRQASIAVAMRAAAGDHEARAGSLGVAMSRAGMTELRFMRLMSAPPETRAEALKRAYMLAGSAGIGIRWGEKEVARILHFLFGTEAAARRSATQWGMDFFASRSVPSGDDGAVRAAASNPQTSINEEN